MDLLRSSAWGCGQGCADKALDRLHEPLGDWPALWPSTRISGWVCFLQRCARCAPGACP